LILRELPGEDRDEDDVVDAEDDLEHGEREQSDPRVWVGEPVHVVISLGEKAERPAERSAWEI
jgi:hypothetical protein